MKEICNEEKRMKCNVNVSEKVIMKEVFSVNDEIDGSVTYENRHSERKAMTLLYCLQCAW